MVDLDSGPNPLPKLKTSTLNIPNETKKKKLWSAGYIKMRYSTVENEKDTVVIQMKLTIAINV